MTRKRFCKLWMAYITRLNEWAKANDCKSMDMGKCYRAAGKVKLHGGKLGITYQEWWDRMRDIDVNLFGVGEKKR